jgi:hypothetical protein
LAHHPSGGGFSLLRPRRPPHQSPVRRLAANAGSATPAVLAPLPPLHPFPPSPPSLTRLGLGCFHPAPQSLAAQMNCRLSAVLTPHRPPPLDRREKAAAGVNSHAPSLVDSRALLARGHCHSSGSLCLALFCRRRVVGPSPAAAFPPPHFRHPSSSRKVKAVRLHKFFPILHYHRLSRPHQPSSSPYCSSARPQYQQPS